MKRKAYTLIELMTVMAITAVLLTIIVLPIFQSFNFTRQAVAFSDAQNHAKLIADRLAGEISGAAAIRDNGGNKGTLLIKVPSKTGTSAAYVKLPYSKIDLYPPAQEGTRGPNGGFINPLTGKEDPTLTAPKGNVTVPATPGFTIVRYAITRRDPFNDYNNPYDGLLMKQNANQDNLYVLRRFEVQPYKLVSGQVVVNTDLFYDLARVNTFTDGLGVSHSQQTGPWYDDPEFLDPTPHGTVPTYASTLPGVTDKSRQEMVQNWLNHSTIVTEISRYDMIQPVYDKRSKQVVYESDGATPRIFPLAQFKPTRVSSEAAQAQVTARPGEETDNAGTIGAEVFKTERGSWSNLNVRLYPNGFQSVACAAPTTDSNDLQHRFLVARSGSGIPGMSIFSYNPVTDGCDETTQGAEIFDLTTYSAAASYPFTTALSAANSRSSWMTGTHKNDILNQFLAFVPYTQEGQVLASFNISEVGDATKTPVITGNLPSSYVKTFDNTGALAPTSQPNLTGSDVPDRVFTAVSDPSPTAVATHPYSPKDTTNGANYDVNMVFNRIWAELPGLRPDIHRFMDLRVTPQSDGTLSPLDPTNGFPRAAIVPGSEVVEGPDQSSGLNYGHLVRYTRVTKNPGPNQYKINYTSLPEPTDYTALGLPNGPKATYDPTDQVTAVFQARYKVGYVQFNSDPNAPIPYGYKYWDGTSSQYKYTYVPITVSYRFQFTQPKDLVTVDYDTRQVMSVLLSVKNFPQSNQPGTQIVTIPATAKVRTILQ